MKNRRALKMHPRLLLDVIMRQAGTVQKAILEAVMNSIEAEAGRVAVLIEPGRVLITDDGRGFRSRQEIEDYFETFGMPHEAAEKKTWAQFRMGRGQLFAFGRNRWRTGPFQMEVDIRQWDRPDAGYDLGYTLSDGLDEAPGCVIDIELYQSLGDREIADAARDLARLVRFVEATVTVNGVVVNTPASRQRWDALSTDDAYVRLLDGHSLSVYNLGVHVQEFPAHTFGCAGVVVSRRRLDVNFARNEVLSSCAVWRRIRKAIDGIGRGRVTARRGKLSSGERRNLVLRILAGEEEAAAHARTGIFPDVTGAYWSLAMIERDGFMRWTAAPPGDGRADTLTQRGEALAVPEGWLDELRLPEPARLFERFGMPGLTFAPFAEAVRGLNSDLSPLAPHKWTPTERVWLRLIGLMYTEVDRLAAHLLNEQPPRQLRVGLTAPAAGASRGRTNAWTDGRSHITFARAFLEANPMMDKHASRPHVRSIARAARVLIHEIVHDDDCATSVHGPDFDRLYRAVIDAALDEAVYRGVLTASLRWQKQAMAGAQREYVAAQRSTPGARRAGAADAGTAAG